MGSDLERAIAIADQELDAATRELENDPNSSYWQGWAVASLFIKVKLRRETKDKLEGAA